MSRGQTTLDFAVGMSVFLLVVAFVLAFVPGMLQPFESGTQQETAAADRVADDLASGALVADRGTPFVLSRECLIGFFALENTDGDAGNDADAYPENDDVVRTDSMYDVSSASWWDGSECHYDVGLGIFDRLGFDGAGVDVHVRLVADVDGDGSVGLLCLNAGAAGDTDKPGPKDAIVETDDPYASGDCDMSDNNDDHDVAFETPDDPPSGSGSVTVARRVVHVEGGLADGTTDAALIVEVW